MELRLLELDLAFAQMSSRLAWDQLYLYMNSARMRGQNKNLNKSILWRSQLATIGDLGEEEGVRGLTCQGRGLGNHTSWRNHRPEEVTGSAEIDVSRLKAEAENAGMKAVEKYRANFHMSPDYEGMMDIF
ncbi:Uncharacterized protein Fot_04154 [Forsythia ovata]|uniref:Uncharacterized protein n=1 Tax=Forsythia ovata TaxID=205694 RepID=A0ABD1XFS9_9LAMI